MDIIGYEGLYKIYDDGRVFGIKRNKFIKPQLSARGYYRIGLYVNQKRNNKSIHKLVALHYIGEPPIGFEVDHIDRDKLNNNISNLRYISRSENQKNRYVYGKISYRYIYKIGNGYGIRIPEKRKIIFRKSSIYWTLEDAIKVRNEAYIKLGIEIDDAIRN